MFLGGLLTLVIIVGVGAIYVVLSTWDLTVASAIGAYVSIVVGLMIILLFCSRRHHCWIHHTISEKVT